jgi:hypothetical protein
MARVEEKSDEEKSDEEKAAPIYAAKKWNKES